MDFTNQYLSYEEYKELGGTLDEVPFNELEYECRRIIDSRTQNRLKNAEEIPQEPQILDQFNTVYKAGSGKEYKVDSILNIPSLSIGPSWKS